MNSFPPLEARDLAYAYRGQAPIFAGLSASFPAGTLTALTGPSGSGKSTLLYTLSGMLTASHGEVLVAGMNLAVVPDWRRSAVRAQLCGFMFQDAVLDPARTLMDNVSEAGIIAGMRRKDASPRAQGLLENFGLAHRVSHLPGQVSGGQAQRVAICRALMNHPRVIFADEPTGNLDAESASTVLAALREAATGGAAVVIATHSVDVVARCDEHIRLRGVGAQRVAS